MVHSYDVGTRAWQPDPTEGWVASEVQSKKVNGEKVTLVFELDNGEVIWSLQQVKSSADKVLPLDKDLSDYSRRTSV